MQMRTSKPAAGNKFYNNGNNGGYSWCINGSPTDKGCNVLSNCVGYACGRYNEIIGSMKYKTLCCNAENFIERAKEAGLQISSVPTLGGIMVWAKGTLSSSDGAGHVAIVERIDNANQIYTSESGWGSSTPFWNQIRKNDNGRWGMSSGYSFRGCIINPAVGDVHYVAPVNPQPTPSTPSGAKFKVGDRVIINGGLYVNANAGSPRGYVNNKETTITRYAAGTKHPYNTTGDLGWMDKERYVMLCGRAKNLIVTSGGKNVYPEEIEDAFQLCDDVNQVTCRGYYKNGDKTSEEIEVLIYPSDDLYRRLGCERNNDFVQDEVYEAIEKTVSKVNKGLQSYEQITKITLLKEPLEMTPTNKVKRNFTPKVYTFTKH